MYPFSVAVAVAVAVFVAIAIADADADADAVAVVVVIAAVVASPGRRNIATRTYRTFPANISPDPFAAPSIDT